MLLQGRADFFVRAKHQQIQPIQQPVFHVTPSTEPFKPSYKAPAKHAPDTCPQDEEDDWVLRVPSGLRNGAKAPVACSLVTPSAFRFPIPEEHVGFRYEPLHNVVILLEPRIIDPAGFSSPVRLVDVHAHVDRSDPLLGMALDLGHKILAGQRCPVDPSPQRVDDVAEGFIAGDGVVGVLDPELDRAGYLALVSGENGAVDGDLGGCRHCGEVGGW